MVITGSTPVYSTIKRNAVNPRNLAVSRDLRRFFIIQIIPQNYKYESKLYIFLSRICPEKSKKNYIKVPISLAADFFAFSISIE